MSYVIENLGNIIVGTIVFVGIFFAVKSQLSRNKKGGCSGCSTGCGGACSSSGGCNHSAKPDKPAPRPAHLR